MTKDLTEVVHAWIREDLDVGAKLSIGYYGPALIERLKPIQELIQRLEGERDEAKAALAYTLDHAVYGDSYGVPGSDFSACHFCMGGGAPGVEMLHRPECPVARYPQVVAAWFEEMADHDKRAEAAEQALSASQKEVERLTPDAARWQALMRCGRIKMQGSSGVDPHTGERNGNNVHFGAEFWPDRDDRFPDLIEGHDKSTAWGLAALRALADAIIERDALQTGGKEHG